MVYSDGGASCLMGACEHESQMNIIRIHETILESHTHMRNNFVEL